VTKLFECDENFVQESLIFRLFYWTKVTKKFLIRILRMIKYVTNRVLCRWKTPLSY